MLKIVSTSGEWASELVQKCGRASHPLTTGEQLAPKAAIRMREWYDPRLRLPIGDEGSTTNW